MWGLFENFKIREIALASEKFDILDVLQSHFLFHSMRATAKHCLGMQYYSFAFLFIC
jgi:hypothetical protein